LQNQKNLRYKKNKKTTMFFNNTKTNINKKIKARLFLASIRSNIKNKIKSFKPVHLVTTVLTSFVLLTTLLGGLSVLNLLPNLDTAKSAKASPVCDAGYTFNTANSLCEKSYAATLKLCFDRTVPATNGTCNYQQLPIFDCGANAPGQTEIFNSPNIGYKFCSKTPEYFAYNSNTSCQMKFFSSSDNSRADNLDAIFNYENRTTFAGNGQTLNGQICTDNTTHCPANFRMIMDQGTLNHALGVTGFYLCANVGFLDGSIMNSSLPVSSLFYTKHTFENTTFNNCGVNDITIGYTKANSGDEITKLCGQGSYGAPVPTCEPTFSINTTITPGTAMCYRGVSPTSFTCPAGQYLTNSGSDTCAVCSAATSYCALGNTNSTQVGISYRDANGAETNLTTVAPGSVVTARVSYDNRTDRAIADASIKTALPAGFQYVLGSFKNCKAPTISEEICDAKTANEKDNMYNAMINTGLSPAATFYDGADTGVNGTATLSTKGILDAGKKRYLNLNGCTYYGSNKTRFAVLLGNGTYGSNSTDASNTPITKHECALGIQADPYINQYTPNFKSYEIFNKKSFNIAQCVGVNPVTNGADTVWTDIDPNSKAFTGTSNGAPIWDGNGNPCQITGGQNYNADDSATNSIDLIGNRYINISNCVFGNVENVRRSNISQFTANSNNAYGFGAQTTYGPMAETNFTCGIGGNGFNRVLTLNKAIDTLDNKRARGYFEFRMTVPTTSLQPSYSQSATFTGKDYTGAAIAPIVQNGTVNISGLQPMVIENANIGTATCSPSTVTQGSTTTCTFPLTGSTTGYVFGPHANVTGINGFTYSGAASATVATAIVSASPTACTISANNLVCTGVPVPSTASVGVLQVGALIQGDDYYGNKGSITVSNSAPTTCNPGYSLVSSACVICPVNSYCTGGTAAAIACTSPATTNGQTGSTSAAACVTANPTTCNPGYSLVSSACVICPVNSYCTGGTAAAIACTSPATTNGQTGSTSAAACVTANPTTCNPGYSLVSSACVICPVNSYCTGGTAAAIACTSPATTNGQTGSTSAAACITANPTTCPAGQYLANNICNICPSTSTCAGGTAQPATCSAPNTVINNVCTAPACLSPNTIVNSVCTPPNNSGSIGTSVATTTTPISTALGSLLPIIPLVGNTYPDGTTATFTLAGTTTAITGTIVSGSFVPTAGQVVPTTATTGPATGILTVGTATLNIPTNFTPTTSTTTIGTPVATTITPITAVVGDPAISIPLIGSTIPDGTVATFTPPGSTTIITGKIIGGAFAPDANQTIPTTGVTTGPAIGILKVDNKIIGVPVNFTQPSTFVPSIGSSVATLANPIGGAVGSRAPVVMLSGNTFSNGTVGTFIPSGTSEIINGKIINGNFIPNTGQLIPLTSTLGTNTGLLRVGTLSLSIPTNFVGQTTNNSGPGNGGVITICSPACTSPTSNNNTATNQTTPTQTPVVTATPVASYDGIFKSKLRITDPYICGEGSYGNVPNPKVFGVDFVYYDFYKVGSTTPSYSYKLRIADNGDFFLPISKSTNVIKEGDYKVVFYAYDNEGNKAQGDYTDFITDNCANSKVVRSGKTDLPRTGGLEILSIFTFVSSVLVAGYLFLQSRSKPRFDLKM
jgi:hypothetical protein